MRKFIPRGSAAPALVITALLVGGGCEPAGTSPQPAEGEREEEDDDEREPEDSDPRLRVLHLSARSGAVDVFVDGEGPVAESLSFTESSPFLALEPGTAALDLVPEGEELDESVLTFRGVELEEGRRYTAFAYDDARLRGGVLEDDASGIDDDAVRLRVIHGSPRVPAVEIVDASGEEPVPLFPSLSRGDVSDAMDVPAGRYTLGMVVSTDGRPNALFPLPELEGGTLVNAFASEDERGDLLLVLQLYRPDDDDDDDSDAIPSDTTRAVPAARAEMRVVHLADAPALDLYVDRLPSPAREDLTFLSASPYLEELAGARSIQLAPSAGTLEDAALSLYPTLAPDGRYTVLALGHLTDGRVRGALVSDDDEGLAEGDMRARVVHGAPDLPAARVYLAEDTGAPLFDTLSFPAVGDTLDLPAGAHTLLVDLDGEPGNADDLLFALPAVSAGSVVTLVLTQDYEVAGAPPFLALLLDDQPVGRVDPG